MTGGINVGLDLGIGKKIELREKRAAVSKIAHVRFRVEVKKSVQRSGSLVHRKVGAKVTPASSKGKNHRDSSKTFKSNVGPC